ncbi:MAG: cohesin domain-containing protein, partial [Desulfobacterales bacterium]|nr:cohesin domain-containing protein [Desulfobacterales bacterium]
MKKQIYPPFMGTLFLFLLLAQGALAKTLSLPLSGALQGNSITLPLTLDTPDGVGGFTCTVSYDTRRLRFLSVENLSKSISDGAGCVQSPSSCSASTVASTLYYRVNTATPGKIKIAAASAVPLSSSSVLGLRFKVKNTAPNGRANITLSPTTLTLASAGYQTATELPVLMGMPAASTNGDGFYTTPTFTTQFSHGGIQVVDPLGIAGSRQVEENARPRYTTTGGSGSGVTWSASQGQISSQGVFTPPNVTRPTVVTITAKDRTYNETTLNPIKTLLNVTVHPQVAINGKPTTPYQISAGGTLTFAANAGPSNLRWEVTKKGATTATGQGQTFAFTAPETGAFAGVYTIRVFDANGFEDTHTIKVPLTVSPSRAVVLEGGRFADIVLSGAPQGTRFHTKVCRNTEASAARDLGQLNPKTNQPDHFIYVAPSAPNGITENKTITLRFTAQDAGLSSEGLADVATGLWTLQNLAGVTGVVKGSGNIPVEGATVSALLAEPVSAVTDSQGRFTLLLPKTNVAITLYVNAPGYIEKSLTSSDLTGNDVITLTPTASQKEISGTLHFDAGLTARPARIRIKDQNGWITRTDGTQVSTTSHPQTGRYTLVLPENASLTGALTIEASAMECVTTSRTLPGNIPSDGTTPINLTLLPLTWIEAEETHLPSGEIKIALTATAGNHRFDGTANEVR